MVNFRNRYFRISSSLIFWGCLVLFVVFLAACSGEKEAQPEEVVEVPQEQIQELEKKVAEKDEVIQKLEQEKSELEELLPQPYTVREGDNHWEIALDYLIAKKGISEDEAKSLMLNSHLFHPISVGFKLWNFYTDGVYGSFLSQGDAVVSPGTLYRSLQKKAEDEKALLESRLADCNLESEKLNDQFASLEQEKKEMEEKLKVELEGLKEKKVELEAEKAERDSRLRSVYYLAGAKSQLKAQGKIKGSFLGICGTSLKDVIWSDFTERVDLEKDDFIELEASDLNVSSIKKVEILPDYFKENTDYRVEILDTGSAARVHLLNKDKFKLARIILCLN